MGVSSDDFQHFGQTRSTATLTDRVATRLAALRTDLASIEAWDWVSATCQTLEESLRIAVIGPAGRGKTTLVNAIVGRQILPVEGATTCVTRVCGGFPERIRIRGQDGSLRTVLADREDAMLGRQLRDLSEGRPCPRSLRVELAQDALTYSSYLDTLPLDAPGVSSSEDSQQRAVTTSALPGDVQAYLLVLSPRDLDSTNATASTVLVRGHAVDGSPLSPATCVVALSHADGVGNHRAGAVDADPLGPAKELLHRWIDATGEPAMDAAVVAGRWACVARCGLLDEPEAAALQHLARARRRSELTEDADGFVHLPSSVSAQHRVQLLTRLGIAGVRVALTLVDMGCNDASALRRELERVSGFGDLRDKLTTLESRSDLLRADQALARLDGYPRNRSDAQAIHDVAEELRLDPALHRLDGLTALHLLAQGPPVPTAIAQEVKRMALTDGPAQRLGKSDGATTEDLVSEAAQGVARWQTFALRTPRAHPEQERLARAMTRSYVHLRRQLLGSYL